MNVDESIQIMKALADSSRLMIVNSLMEKAQCVEELAERFNLAASTVSFHLKKLENARLLHKEKRQYYVFFSLNPEIFTSTLQQLISFENIGKYVQEERILKYKEKVIHTFFEKGKLRRLPSQHKKRWIVLEQIAQRFETGKEYSEADVNATISTVFDDYCSIRRELVDEGIMERDGQRYRLSERKFDESPKLRPNSLQHSYQQSISHRSRPGKTTKGVESNDRS
ncbi:MAG: metalloregulator ArsR/SmtB family transcription factor [Candidatus Zhuqueibacterota bacterium]